MKPKLLVSACLLGQPVRYDGQAKASPHETLQVWRAEGRIVPVCPELAGGLGVPRPPAEIAEGRSGASVLLGEARVLDSTERDVTKGYLAGAQAALMLARTHDCRFALLVDGSPSCASKTIHDGTFSGRKHAGVGVTTALLRANGISVFSEDEIDDLKKLIG